MIDADPEVRLADLLPPGRVPIGYVVSMECMDEHGNLSLVHIKSSDLPPWRAEYLMKYARMEWEHDTEMAAFWSSDDDGEDGDEVTC